jgi:hypothetical protein
VDPAGAERAVDRARISGIGAGIVGAALTPLVWLVVGPWDLSTGAGTSEAAGAARVFAVLAAMDLLAMIGWWRRWLTPLATTVGAGVAWTALAFAVAANARGAGANMAGVWLFFGPVVVVMNSTATFTVAQIVLALRRRVQ